MGIDSYNPTVRARLSNATKTRVLNLKESALHRIPDDVQKIVNLRHLDISFNYLTALPAYIGSFSQLKVLHFGRNSLESLPEELGNLENLETLSFSQNKIAEIPGSLAKCASLKSIEAVENQFVEFPTVFCEIPNLETLVLTNNRIEKLPDEIASIRAISIQINKNRITSLNSSNLSKCPRLRLINLDENQLNLDEIQNFLGEKRDELKISFENNVSQIHTNNLMEMGNESSKGGSGKSIGENARKIVGKSGPSSSTVNKHLEMASKSRILQLKGSGLKRIPDEVENLAEILRNLELSENKIREIPVFLGKFQNLKQLHLANNCIEAIPDEVGYLKNLEVLNIPGNKLAELPDTIAGCTSLKTLDLSSNSFRVFPKAVFAIMALEFLNLNSNQIENLPDEISDLKVIELSLNQNRLQSLNAARLILCPRLKTLRVEENCLEKREFTRELLENSEISNITYQGNVFQLKEFQDLQGYEAYQERFTATKRKM
ncbi:unnamed protein product [Caenorhabditis angaria]|uniref:Disease resistance R13L4/SHOC-2-like LRR domain-containing protein n=1 Tax=Caenorhabditis angaria TaxID=860376 RepID=A0A9P1IE11_9PELO|nr:unnamed protein product [Caenorhabditis angaria]